ncbi:acetyl-CoA carboxylase biotin carboxylase subunit [Aestuariispira insulae]|uniref:3-methylcrotonoyl-CoA carboxylase alpha subunit n=1 Tax=Aestuariispira insulae TaxID=1461337 RepID=A0A3D9HSY0_9PROT|nr:acetyl/propionyl/methylcrotonyl-CoA carboxylase subunit alpha [Aestuariispira insulae]RED52550.1 3-methylcrotonoyl-CoA carboxylase alpha subunit [Aestuariispira insulae]
MFEKILIANRGEIACRVIETAQSMGIATVAVYSDADCGAKHVALADEAVHIGPAPVRESYLLGERIIEAAKQTGAQAIHPGYGFLSENAGFADLCAKNDLIFIGPPADAIRAMGSKSQAKEIMDKAGVPLVPGYHGDNQDPDFLAAEADKMGYPVLIKASLGGGGKGMRLVEKAADFAASLESCKREAVNAFGDDHVLVERFVTRPRHIEMQVFADSHGQAVHLFERDCSVQRRHQKVLEEAPAPGMNEELRAEMGKAATDAALAIGYQGAGTVEFIVETSEDGVPGAFFFMEMNTRLQVEHPVTEMITGEDLVAWQLKVASGMPLPKAQSEITCTGHALEARLYAEDPANDFLPAIGRLHHFKTPNAIARIDSGVRAGDEVSMHYDPMIAKVITHGADRSEAIRRMVRALEQTEVAGLVTNRDFLKKAAGHPAFGSGLLDTSFIEKYETDLLPNEGEGASVHDLAFAALALLRQRDRQARSEADHSADPWSPWGRTDNWRLNDTSNTDIRLQPMGASEPVMVHAEIDGQDYHFRIADEVLSFAAVREEGLDLTAQVNGVKAKRAVHLRESALTVIGADRTQRLTLIDPMAAAGEEEGGSGRMTAPMPGKITAVKVNAGESVEEGQALMVVEAMKMEHTIAAPHDGVVAEVRFAVGDQVAEGDELISFEEV